MTKVTHIAGITGQDECCLAEFLSDKSHAFDTNYDCHE
jgi:GDP-D-mannose dehydratase